MDTFHFLVSHHSGEFFVAVEAVDVKAAKTRLDGWLDRTALEANVDRATEADAWEFGEPVLVN